MSDLDMKNPIVVIGSILIALGYLVVQVIGDYLVASFCWAMAILIAIAYGLVLRMHRANRERARHLSSMS